MKKAFLILLCFAFTVPALAQGGNRLQKIDSLMNYYYSNNKFMGSLSIRERGQLVYDKAYGFADVQTKQTATKDTKYKIGAVTKMFTATLIFQLIEEKKLTLKTKLSEFYPKIKNADKITIASMLNHKSGIFDINSDPAFPQFVTKLQTRKNMLDRLYAYEPAFAPDTKAEYSNSNYLLLGYIIQDITKKTYKESVAQRIAKKALLKNTYYYGKTNPKRNEAYSYAFDNGKWKKQDEWHETAIGASGGLVSTTSDLTKFIQALFDGKLINAESVAEMNKIDMGYGKGVLNFMFAERRFTGHNGTIEGFNSVLGYYPKEQVGFSLILNGANCDFNELVLGILSCYYKLPYRFPDFVNKIAVDETILKKYEGKYTNPSMPFVIEVTLVEGVLRVHADEQGTFYITPTSTTEFKHEGSGVVMEFTADGFVLKQNGTGTKFTKQKL
jgi:CubicO group peptidase (beta-lactamase class C family)